MMLNLEDNKYEVEEDKKLKEDYSAAHELWKAKCLKVMSDEQAKAFYGKESRKRLEQINLLGLPCEMEQWASDYCERFGLEEPGTANGNREVCDVTISEYEQLRRILNRTPTLKDFLSDDENDNENIPENNSNEVE